MTAPAVIAVTDHCHVARARVAATSRARAAGFTKSATCLVATSVSELATNLFVHTSQGGILTIRVLDSGGRVGVEILAEDDGPGIPDLSLAMQDGFSTAGGLGGGLPGVKRMMDEFEITSEDGQGVRVVARKWRDGSRTVSEPVDPHR
ncbi:ATP-binding protein [Planctomycetota bacterium]